jgi:hypothetical protein
MGNLDLGSGMNIPDHSSRVSKQFLGLKIHKCFDADADPGSFLPWIQDPGWKNSDPGAGINVPDLQHRLPGYEVV